MIDKATLKKYNLKAVSFSCIGEGQAFWSHFYSFNVSHSYRLIGGSIEWGDGYNSPICTPPSYFKNATVYVPVWRPC